MLEKSGHHLRVSLRGLVVAPNIMLKPTHLVVTIFANSAKIAPPAARGLTRCYVDVEWR